MPKFEVMVTEHIQRSVQNTLTITKKAVVDAMGLKGEDAKNWQEHVRDYVEQEWDSICDGAERGDVTDEDVHQTDIDAVSNLDE